MGRNLSKVAHPYYKEKVKNEAARKQVKKRGGIVDITTLAYLPTEKNKQVVNKIFGSTCGFKITLAITTSPLMNRFFI